MKDIPELLEAIQSFQILQCEMQHEKVAIGLDRNPIHNFQDGVIVFDRVNLCDIKHRNRRLGCAHSCANTNFERVLDDLVIRLPQYVNQILAFKNEFKSVITLIYGLDHKVGNLEHDLAICKLNNDGQAKDEILSIQRLLKSEHRQLLHHLSKIKSDIEQLIKKELNYSVL